MPSMFSILRTRSIRLREPLEPLLELESGSNDPMAVILTVGLISVITAQVDSVLSLVGMLTVQLAVGAVAGVAIGFLGVWLVNALRLQQEGLYVVVTVAIVALAYGGAAAGKRIIDLRLPEQVLIVLIARDNDHIVPSGSTVLQTGDSVLVAASEAHDPQEVRTLLA